MSPLHSPVLSLKRAIGSEHLFNFLGTVEYLPQSVSGVIEEFLSFNMHTASWGAVWECLKGTLHDDYFYNIYAHKADNYALTRSLSQAVNVAESSYIAGPSDE
ncbi:hypothetical protein GDO81_004887 [Engystomops pustulosus]|uniref:Uncharacterized protein n=1 Tax=Engystomops pustulosus TaxID=76066 RepID=A0AAV7CJ63_ENGPU|nr:hypothetical protein GDO81_004887 [Engystomops pustulosus]